MGKQWKQWGTLFWGAPKSLQMVIAPMKLRDTCSLEEKLWQTKRQHIKKQRHCFANKGSHSQSHDFSQVSCPTLCDSIAPSPCPSLSPRVCSNSCPLSQWCRPTISSSVTPFSFCFQSFLGSGLLQWVNSSPEVANELEFQPQQSVLPMKTQDWFSLGWTGWMSLQSKGLSRVFSNTTVQKHQFFSTQLSL